MLLPKVNPGVTKDHKYLRSKNSLWTEFIEHYPIYKSRTYVDCYHFCDNKKDADQCFNLVLKGIKKATATSLWWYEYNDEELPKIGQFYIVKNWEGSKFAVIEITKVERVPFNKVTNEFAEIEGEGDKSLAYWKRVHKAYYTREMAPLGLKFQEDMVVVCEYFRLRYH